MSRYAKMISNTPLIEKVDSAITTGDLEYDATALEISETNGNELFHVVIDQNGNRQCLFFRSEGDYRIPIELLEKIIEVGKTKVNKCG